MCCWSVSIRLVLALLLHVDRAKTGVFLQNNVPLTLVDGRTQDHSVCVGLGSQKAGIIVSQRFLCFVIQDATTTHGYRVSPSRKRQEYLVLQTSLQFRSEQCRLQQTRRDTHRRAAVGWNFIFGLPKGKNPGYCGKQARGMQNVVNKTQANKGSGKSPFPGERGSTQRELLRYSVIGSR